MDSTSLHPWHAQLQTPLSPELTAQALSDDDPQWEYIDSQMVKLGSLAHSTLDIDDIQQQAVELLATKSKDFRLMVHLLRTLQHAGQPEELMLAISLLTEYIQLFWTVAWPQNPLHKRRFAQQILKRFDSASSSFSQKANDIQRENVQGLLAHLAQVWHSNEPVLAKEVDRLRISYARKEERIVETVTPFAQEASGNTGAAMVVEPALVRPSLNIDNSSDKAWRQTLLKMADLLCELQPEEAIGFRLRRYALWGMLTAPPMSQSDGRTPLAAVSADRTADYLVKMSNADLPLWQQVEQSLTLAPYWLDGHVLSAQIAMRLGYESVAQAIRDELTAFLKRLPALKTLSFSDMTPFLSPQSFAWLQQDEAPQGGSHTIEQDEIWQCYQQQGLEAALQMINQQQQSEPRDRFYSQLLSAQLLEKAGLSALAQQHYCSLLLVGQQLQLNEWEPTLINLLTEKQRQFKS